MTALGVDGRPHTGEKNLSRRDSDQCEDEEEPFYKDAFDYFDWNHSSSIPTSVSKHELEQNLEKKQGQE